MSNFRWRSPIRLASLCCRYEIESYSCSPVTSAMRWTFGRFGALNNEFRSAMESAQAVHDGSDEEEVDDRPYIGPRRLPNSLASLRAFEAVARRQSFTKAAVELSLTQTAVSHQVRKLEHHLRAKLFVRDRDAVRLSDTGRQYLPAVRGALNMLSAATQRIVDQSDEGTLSIVSLAGFGLKCLLPLLPDFRRRYPSIRIRFESVVSHDAKASYNYDVSIRYGSGDWPGMVTHRIAPEELFPVCSPTLLTSSNVTSHRDMLRHTAICTSSVAFRDDWPEWLALYGCSPDEFADWVCCDTMLSASQAAIDGLGFAMGRTPLVDRDIREGRLIEPFQRRLKSNTGYYVTSTPEHARRKTVKMFVEWLLEQFTHVES
ncbi:LysR family transcriptional regulator [Burkholderia ubonensis]|nr:LysR family transcriptional regulator [Burkholderia ubonensis]